MNQTVVYYLLFLHLLFLAGLYPLGRAWWANRTTSLLQAVNWTITAWVAWIMSGIFALEPGAAAGLDPGRFLSLSLTGCAGVAVLGARRPHVGAWNFVILGLLAVMILPLVESWLVGKPFQDPLRMFFLAGVLAAGFLNYLPTRLAGGVILAALGCTGEMVILLGPAHWPGDWFLTRLCLGLSPWAGWIAWHWQGPPAHEVDRLWLDFRNRFGLFWGQRLREQFNRSALNSGWPFFLSWTGLRRLAVSGPDTVKPEEILHTLQALLKRFGLDRDAE